MCKQVHRQITLGGVSQLWRDWWDPQCTTPVCYGVRVFNNTWVEFIWDQVWLPYSLSLRCAVQCRGGCSGLAVDVMVGRQAGLGYPVIQHTQLLTLLTRSAFLWPRLGAHTKAGLPVGVHQCVRGLPALITGRWNTCWLSQDSGQSWPCTEPPRQVFSPEVSALGLGCLFTWCLPVQRHCCTVTCSLGGDSTLPVSFAICSVSLPHSHTQCWGRTYFDILSSTSCELHCSGLQGSRLNSFSTALSSIICWHVSGLGLEAVDMISTGIQTWAWRALWYSFVLLPHLHGDWALRPV